jgi:hypothetical protein
MDLETALEQFDIAEANLRRLQKVWDEMLGMVPGGITFIGASEEGRRYRELQHAYEAIAQALPAIGDFRIKEVPMSLDEIAQSRLDAADMGEPQFAITLESAIDAPGLQIQDYGFKLQALRAKLTRRRAQELISVIDTSLAGLTATHGRTQELLREEPAWSQLVGAFDEVERIAGSAVTRNKAWTDLHRHLSFAMGVDAHDIRDTDWPVVRKDFEASLYGALEPLPMTVDDLQGLVASEPKGAVTTKLNWEQITPEGFERLIFNLIGEADGYSNPGWLMRTNAPDRGRDLSVERVTADALTGSRHERVIIQARHRLAESVSANDVASLLAEVTLWGPPRVHVLIIATSGRFTQDAVAYIEKHNDTGKQPQVEMWPESHLELLLARRPHLIAEMKLR